MSVIDLEETNKHVPDPFVVVLEEPDKRLDQIRKDIQRLQGDTNRLNEAWKVEEHNLEKRIKAADNAINWLSKHNDTSRNTWIILGTTFLVLTAVNLIKGGPIVWRWFKRIRSGSGGNQKDGGNRTQMPRRTHPRRWEVIN